jgi:hypothetical protein
MMVTCSSQTPFSSQTMDEAPPTGAPAWSVEAASQAAIPMAASRGNRSGSRVFTGLLLARDRDAETRLGEHRGLNDR